MIKVLVTYFRNYVHSRQKPVVKLNDDDHRVFSPKSGL